MARWQEIQLLQSQVVHLRQEMKDMHSESDCCHAINQQQNQKVIKLLHRITATPRRCQVTQQDDGLPDVAPVPGATPVQTPSTVVVLMRGPKTLHDLWVKWKFCTGGRKLVLGGKMRHLLLLSAKEALLRVYSHISFGFLDKD